MKDRISGGVYTNGFRTVFVKPTKEEYELTQKGVSGVRKIRKDNIQYEPCSRFQKDQVIGNCMWPDLKSGHIGTKKQSKKNKNGDVQTRNNNSFLAEPLGQALISKPIPRLSK